MKRMKHVTKTRFAAVALLAVTGFAGYIFFFTSETGGGPSGKDFLWSITVMKVVRDVSTRP